MEPTLKRKMRRGERGAILVFGAQALFILVAFFVAIIHAFNGLTASVQVRRIAERVAGSMVNGFVEAEFPTCAAAAAQFQRLTEESAGWSVTFGLYTPDGGFVPSADCGAGSAGNAFEISLDADRSVGMIGLVPKMFENEFTLRPTRVLGYVQSGKGYLRVL